MPRLHKCFIRAYETTNLFMMDGISARVTEVVSIGSEPSIIAYHAISTGIMSIPKVIDSDIATEILREWAKHGCKVTRRIV